jgi:hypothetical protein
MAADSYLTLREFGGGRGGIQGGLFRDELEKSEDGESFSRMDSKKWDKASLFEMDVVGESARDSAFGHEVKGNTVGERPIIIGPRAVQREAGGE